MKAVISQISAIAAFVLVWSVSCCQAQTAVVKPPLAEELGKAWGYSEAIDRQLDHIATRFPALKPAATAARMTWDIKWGQAAKQASVRLRSLAGSKWEYIQKDVMSKADGMIKTSALTEADAISYLRDVRAQTDGLPVSPVGAILLANDPGILSNPAIEIQKGFVSSFSTKGHPKAKSVSFSIKCPLSWLQEEGERPNIIQKWTSDHGHGSDVFLLIVKKLPGVPSKDEALDLFTEASAREMVGKSGKLLRFSASKLEQQPVGIIQFTQSVQRLDASVTLKGTMYYLVVGDALVFLQGMCNLDLIPATERDAHVQKLGQLFNAIANTLVLESRYK